MKLENYLDRSNGDCFLRNLRIAAFSEAAMLHHNAARLQMPAWVIMPNHVHTLIQPGEPNALSQTGRANVQQRALPQSLPNGAPTGCRLCVTTPPKAGHRPALPFHPEGEAFVLAGKDWGALSQSAEPC
jgi:hypothetical protein